MRSKYRKNKRKGCFRRLSHRIQVFIVLFHITTLVILTVVLGMTLYTSKLQASLAEELHGHDSERAKDVERWIYGAVVVRALAACLGFYSVKRRHSPAIVMLLTAMIFVVSIVMLVVGSTILSRYGSIMWIRDLIQSEMERLRLDKNETRFVRDLQSQKKCCGILSYKDWQTLRFGVTSLRVPPSCCLNTTRFVKNYYRNVSEKLENKFCGQNFLPDHPKADRFIHTQGCFTVLTRKFVKILSTIAAFCLLLAIVDGSVAAFGFFLILKDYV